MKGKGGPQKACRKYRGVRQRNWGIWVSEICKPNRGKRTWLGSFKDSKSAALAYDRAAIRIFGPTAKLNFPKRLPDAASSTCPTSVDAIADQRHHKSMLNFLDKLRQMSLPIHATASSSVNALFNQEGIKFPETGIIDMQQDEYPPWDEVSLIANPYACLINDHVYNYSDQFKLQERLHSVAPNVDHQGNNVVKNNVYLIEKHDNIKENMRVEFPEYVNSSLCDEAMTTTFGKVKDPGVVVAGKFEVGTDDLGGDLGLINFWF